MTRQLPPKGPVHPATATRHSGNQLLALLSPAVRARLSPHLKRVDLKPKEFLCHAHIALRSVYFPDTGLIALVTRLHDGETLEVGLVGRDGMAGLSVFPGVNAMACDAVVQIGGTALRIGSDILRREVRPAGPVHELFGRYAHLVLARGMIAAACNNFHPVKKRCARWLLMAHDIIEDDEFPLTQELLATMLGVRRSSVAVVAAALQRVGLIEYRLGRVKIRNREGLEAASCECYHMMREEQRRLMHF